MKKFFALLLSMMLALTLCFGLTGCNDESDTITVYTEAGFAPFEYVENGKIVGVDVDIMNMVGRKLGKRVVFENVAFDTICDAVSKGELCDVGAAGLSVTESRKKQVAFSNEYYTAELYVIYKTADATKYESITTDGVTGVYWDSMKGDMIAVQTGTTADLFLGDEIAEGGSLYDTTSNKYDASSNKMNVRTGFSQLSQALTDLEVNSDVLIIDELPAKMLIEGKSQYKCAPLYYQGAEQDDPETTDEDESLDVAAIDVYAIAVAPNQSARLLATINEVLAELGEEGIQNLVNKHLGLTD